MYGVLILCGTPDLVNQLIVCPYHSGVTSQDVQQLILGRRQSDLLLADENLSPVEIHFEIASREYFVLSGAEGLSQGRPDSRQQFSQGKRFINVIVSARIEAGDYFGFFILSR